MSAVANVVWTISAKGKTQSMRGLLNLQDRLRDLDRGFREWNLG